MKKSRIYLYAIAVLSLALFLLIAGCKSIFYQPNKTSISQRQMSVIKAKKTLIEANKPLYGQCYANIYSSLDYPAVMKVEWDGIEFVFQKKQPKDFLIPYKCKFSDMDPVVWELSGSYSMEFGESCKIVHRKIWGSILEVEKAIADAVYILKHAGREDPKVVEAKFAEQAKKYREMMVKPPLPENAQRFKLMAEDAFQNKKFGTAAEYYEKALEIEPLWPEGQFNVALLYGELKDYENAALHMRRYLELVPDAKDAKEARDKMYLWEGKAKEAGKE